MDSEWKIYLNRAENELVLAKANFDISIKIELKRILGIALDKTFFNDVISESYYSIFYSAKAYLLFNSIKTSPPEEHKKTYEEFKKMVDSGKISFSTSVFHGWFHSRMNCLWKMRTKKSIPSPKGEHTTSLFDWWWSTFFD